MKISPSVLAADFSKLAAEVARVEKAGVDMLHLDVMDGNFVPNISFGAPVIKSLRPHSKLLFDVHLMIDRPERYIADFVKAGADSITIHYESTEHPAEVLTAIREAGLKSAVSVSPNTPIEVIYPLLPLCDMVLVMTVEPGFGGQKLIPATLDKVKALSLEIKRQGLAVDIQADGGINDDTLADVLAAGVNVVVAGSSIFGAPDSTAAVAKMRAFG
jgi:ribulose-phosphate 3-epimerase